ncbi:General alpha-glucoside permease [Rhodotorula toruloides]|nr:General alpha-glucoside permease [Rhodotorula toruloides]
MSLHSKSDTYKMDEKQVEDSSFVEEGHTAVAKAPDGGLNVRQALSVWRKGVAWSVVLSLAVMMESYNTILLNSLYAAPPFQKDYGMKLKSGKYQIPSEWQSALGSGTVAATIIGVLVAAPLIDRFGYRKVMIGGLVWAFGFSWLIFLSKDLAQLLAGNMCSALPWGAFIVCAVSYAVEVVPTSLRSYLSSYVNLCFVIGHVIAAGVLRASISYKSVWTYKLPFLLICIPPLPIALALCWAPESPYWLARKGRLEDAAVAMDRLHAPHPDIDSKALVAHIHETYKVEQEMRTGGSFVDLFKGSNLRRTELATIAWTSPGLVGYVVQFYQTFFFTRAGFPTDKAFALGLGSYAIAFVGGVVSWFLQARLGRRTIILCGLSTMLPIMLLVGSLDFVKSQSGHWAQAILFLVWFFFYGSTQGPIPYAVASEIPAVKLRAKTLAIARSVYYTFFISSTVLSPYMLQTWDMKGKAAYPAAGFTAFLLVWTYFRLPETKNRSFEELDIMFGLRLPARKFSSYVVTEEDRRTVGHI